MSLEILKKCNSWSDFQTLLQGMDNKQKGTAFELLTQQFFKLNPVYSFYDDVWLLNEAPDKVLKHLAIPRQDLGIDIIAKKGTEYHAIQCKYHSDQTNSVTFKEVSTFLTLLEANKNISQGYICSTADISSRHLNAVRNKPVSLLLSDTWNTLGYDFFARMQSALKGKIKALTPLKPRPHQKKAINKAKEFFITRNNSRGKLIFPCGSGKSLTGFWLTQELQSKKTLIAVPSLSLIKQTLEVYLREVAALKKKVYWLCICSDEGIGINDDVTILTENIGVPCQTNPEFIINWLRENRNNELIIFTTYQSGKLIAEASKKLNFQFNVGIFDEAHKTVGSDKKLFSYLLFDANIDISKRIFMTATERFYSGTKDDVLSMDDATIYGETFMHMSFKEAIQSDLLTDYKVVTIEVKKSEIAEFIRNNNLVELNDKWRKETEARSLAAMIALRKAMRKFPIRNAVSFHSSIDKAIRNSEIQEHITESYGYPDIESFTVSGKQATSLRNNIVQEFARSNGALITNARCLTEGVDVPNIDCIVFADPRKSRIDIVQALGRALRKKDDKQWGYVILPVIYDEKTGEVDNENFSEIVSIVRSLASNDDRIIEYFRDKHDIKGNKNQKQFDEFQFDILSDYIDEATLKENLSIKLWEKLGKLSWMPFLQAREFVRSIGLKSYSEWRLYNQKRPSNIPFSANTIYRSDGWISWGDWFGSGQIATNKITFVSYDEAKKYASSLKLNTTEEWFDLKNKSRPKGIPSNPKVTYKGKGWTNWGDFLGLKNYRDPQIGWLSFQEARLLTRSLGLKSANDWYKYAKSESRHPQIPKSPAVIYKNHGWKGIGDWIGTDRIADQFRIYLSFEDAKNFMRENKIKSEKQWQDYRIKNNIQNIPFKLERTYSKFWKGFADFFGNEPFTFNEAKNYIKNFEIRSSRAYYDFVRNHKETDRLPLVPYRVFKDSGWKDWKDYLGYEKRNSQKKEYASFDTAKEFCAKMKFLNGKEYANYIRKNPRPYLNKLFTLNPERIYENSGWIGWADYLGNTAFEFKYKNFATYEEAKKIISKFQLMSVQKFQAFSKTENRPSNIPANPYGHYSKTNEWKGWKDFLGK